MRGIVNTRWQKGRNMEPESKREFCCTNLEIVNFYTKNNGEHKKIPILKVKNMSNHERWKQWFEAMDK